jgi:hypothetical protein
MEDEGENEWQNEGENEWKNEWKNECCVTNAGDKPRRPCRPSGDNSRLSGHQ